MDEVRRSAVPVKHHELTSRIIGVFYDVYNELGDGFFEVVYREAMQLALTQAGLRVGAEIAVPVHFRGVVVRLFRADLVVNDVVLIELKALEQVGPRQESQVLRYLRATDIEVGLLMNFGPSAKFRRFFMNNESKGPKRKGPESEAGVNDGISLSSTGMVL